MCFSWHICWYKLLNLSDLLFLSTRYDMWYCKTICLSFVQFDWTFHWFGFMVGWNFRQLHLGKLPYSYLRAFLQDLSGFIMGWRCKNGILMVGTRLKRAIFAMSNYLLCSVHSKRTCNLKFSESFDNCSCNYWLPRESDYIRNILMPSQHPQFPWLNVRFFI